MWRIDDENIMANELCFFFSFIFYGRRAVKDKKKNHIKTWKWNLNFGILKPILNETKSIHSVKSMYTCGTISKY